jgi:hypothetical protein
MVYSQLYLIDALSGCPSWFKVVTILIQWPFIHICGAIKAYYVFTHARIYIFELWLFLATWITLFYAEWYKCYDSNNLNLVTNVL